MSHKLVLLALLLFLFPFASTAQEIPLGDALQIPGAWVICEGEELDVQVLYVAGPHDSGSIHVTGSQGGAASPEFKRTNIEQIECEKLSATGNVTVFEVHVVRSVNLTRNIETEGFSLSSLTDLLDSADQLADMFSQLAQNVVDILESQDITCLGVVSERGIVTLAC